MIISIGEVLWDYVDNQKLIGGSPLNVAFYLKQSAENVKLISRVGNDENGKEILEKIKGFNLDIINIQIDDSLETGKVLVALANGQPEYNILENVAWDNINIPDINEEYNIVFSSLAQRNETSAKTIKNLVKNAKLKFYDVNLRFPYTTENIVIESLKISDIVKFNNDELEIIYSWVFDNQIYDLEYKANKIREKFDLKAIALTLGENGSMLITESDTYKEKAIKVNVADTIGCGDAFFATLIANYLKNINWSEALKKANQVASYVASKKGAINTLI